MPASNRSSSSYSWRARRLSTISLSPAIPGPSLGAAETDEPEAEDEERREAECICDCDWHAPTIGLAQRAVVTAGGRLEVCPAVPRSRQTERARRPARCFAEANLRRSACRGASAA